MVLHCLKWVFNKKKKKACATGCVRLPLLVRASWITVCCPHTEQCCKWVKCLVCVSQSHYQTRIIFWVSFRNCAATFCRGSAGFCCVCGVLQKWLLFQGKKGKSLGKQADSLRWVYILFRTAVLDVSVGLLRSGRVCLSVLWWLYSISWLLLLM